MNFKKIALAALLVAGSIASKASAPDEGMWIPSLINKNYDEMKKLGFKLTAQDVYNINNNSLKDAIVSLGFCTGEIISGDGLMLTNHHCGYSTIQYHSAVEHDYLTDGFWAKTKADELPSQEVTASILVRVEDVSDRILKEVSGLSEVDRAAKLKEVIKTITDEATKGTINTASVKDMFGGNQYFLFVYEKYTDVRLVGAPPSSVGKFGGDTDNWVWPRHTGDFSIFRIYMSKDGKPAPYSKDNVPYKPKKFLPISIKGLKPGDYTMVMGYPGRTNRYAFSRELQNAVEKVNPALIELFGKRLETMKADMDKDAAVRIRMADTYASLANSWKYYLGQNDGLKKLGVIDYKKGLEAKFAQYANSKPELTAKYGTVLSNIDKAFDDYKPYVLNAIYLNVAGLASTASAYASQFTAVATAIKGGNADEIKKATDAIKGDLDEHFKDYWAATDKQLFAELLTLYYNDLQASEKPAYLEEVVKSHPAATPAASFKLYADEVFGKSMFVNKDKVAAFLANPTQAALDADPLFVYIGKLDEFKKTYAAPFAAFGAALAKEKRSYIAGLMEMAAGKNMYPDANSTMRLSYGQVKNYSPKDGMEYDFQTTSDGILEKYKAGDQEFDVPVKLIDLIKAKNFGQYALPNGKLPVAFISDNDITGGNSGSPVINANGELVGCAFDGNWEAMTGDLVFDKNYKRTISVDIRYVLFIIDKYAGATNLISEMDIRK